MFPYIQIHTLERVLVHITSPAWDVVETNQIYWIVPLTQYITVKEMKMQELGVMVRTSQVFI